MKDERMTELRQDYETIPVPQELKERVIRSMEQAKEELTAPLEKIPVPLSPGCSRRPSCDHGYGQFQRNHRLRDGQRPHPRQIRADRNLSGIYEL